MRSTLIQPEIIPIGVINAELDQNIQNLAVQQKKPHFGMKIPNLIQKIMLYLNNFQLSQNLKNMPDHEYIRSLIGLRTLNYRI